MIDFIDDMKEKTHSLSMCLLPQWVWVDPFEQQCVAASAPSLFLPLAEPDTHKTLFDLHLTLDS